MKIVTKLRNMRFSRSSATNINHVAISPEVQHALIKWIRAKVGTVAPGVLIGGLALAFYAPPRYTQDADFLFLTDADIPATPPNGFRRHRKGAFEEKHTGVEIEVSSAASINLPSVVAQKVFETAHNYDGILVASLEAMLVLKLYGADVEWRNHKDLEDIQSMLRTHPTANISGWSIKAHHKNVLEECRRVSLLKPSAED